MIRDSQFMVDSLKNPIICLLCNPVWGYHSRAGLVMAMWINVYKFHVNITYG